MVAPLGTCSGCSPAGAATASDMDQQSGLAWFDLESAAAGDINMGWRARVCAARPGTGSTRRVTGLTPRRRRGASDGTKVLFTMTDKVKSGRLATSGIAHLYTVPYSKTAPQAATPVPGDGSAAGKAQYYGVLSATTR